MVSSFAFVSDINAINDSVNRLWGHVSRFGPPEMPDLGLRGLGRFEVPPPPPPPPLPPASPRWHEEVADWASRNRVLVGTLCVGAVGAGLLAGYSASAYTKARTRTRHAQKTIGSNLSSRRLLVGKYIHISMIYDMRILIDSLSCTRRRQPTRCPTYRGPGEGRVYRDNKCLRS